MKTVSGSVWEPSFLVVILKSGIPSVRDLTLTHHKVSRSDSVPPPLSPSPRVSTKSCTQSAFTRLLKPENKTERRDEGKEGGLALAATLLQSEVGRNLLQLYIYCVTLTSHSFLENCQVTKSKTANKPSWSRTSQTFISYPFWDKTQNVWIKAANQL